MIVPRVPSGVSGTALAASLLRDGWSVCVISSVLIVFCATLQVFHISSIAC
jgi:hypothetical protein